MFINLPYPPGEPSGSHRPSHEVWGRGAGRGVALGVWCAEENGKNREANEAGLWARAGRGFDSARGTFTFTGNRFAKSARREISSLSALVDAPLTKVTFPVLFMRQWWSLPAVRQPGRSLG